VTSWIDAVAKCHCLVLPASKAAHQKAVALAIVAAAV
jgi:hypothetical protein